MEFKDYVKFEWKKCVLKIKVLPNSQETCFVEAMSDWVLKIRLKSVPEKWKANIELIKYISRELKINKSNISIILWFTDKNKLVKIDF